MTWEKQKRYTPNRSDLATSFTTHQFSLTIDTRCSSSSTVSETPWNTWSFLYNQIKRDTKATRESKALSWSSNTPVRPQPQFCESGTLLRNQAVPTQTAQHLKPKLPANNTINKEVINRLRRMGAKCTGVIVSQPVQPAQLSSPTPILNCQP
jgi:hypothetical protein